MSDNIYNILNNFNKVAQEPQQPATQTQPKAKTRLQENMDRVLAEKYMGFKKTVAAVKKGGSAENPEAVAAAIGRKKYGKEKFQKAAAAGKKLGESEIDSSKMNKQHQDFYAKNPHFKKGDKEVVDVGRTPGKSSLATKVTPSKTSTVTKKPMTSFGKGVAEGSSENKYSNLSNRGVNRGINRAADDFDRMLDLDQVESPHYTTQHQQDTKKRLKTKPMAGPKGVLPEGNDGNLANNAKPYDKVTRSDVVAGRLGKDEMGGKKKNIQKSNYKRKVEEAIKAMMEAGFTKEQIVEGWDDMMKAVANRNTDMKTGQKRQGAKGEIEKTASGIKHTRRYDRKTGETETGSDGEQVKRSRGRPKKSQFESASKDSTTINKMIVETFRDIIEGSIQGGVWTSNPPKKGQPNVPVPQNIDGGSVSPAPKTPSKTAPSKPEPPMGSIKGGVWTSEPPKSGEKGVPVPVPVDEADMEEGNYFSGQLAKARTAGKKQADLDGDGDMEPVRENEEEVNEAKCMECGMLESKCKCDDKVSESLNLFRRLAGLKECGMSPIAGYAQDMQDSQGNMNISTNMNSDGTKSVTISADGNSALELMQMLKLAGMAGGDMPQEKPEGVMVVSTGDDEELSERMPLPKIGADGQPDPADMQKLQQAMTSRQQQSQELTKQNALNTAKPETSNPATQASSEAPPPGLPQKTVDVPEEQEVDEAKDERYHASTTPEEHVMSVQVQTKGGNGDVAGKEKKMTPNGYQFGDNPQAMKESMSLKLIKEYETIKVKK